MFNIFPARQLRKNMPVSLMRWVLGTFENMVISFNEMDYTFNEFKDHKEDFTYGTFEHLYINFNNMDYTFNEFHLHASDFI